MARIKINTSINSKSYSIIDDYYRNGKRTTRVVDTIGNYEKVSKLAESEGIDVDTWLINYLNNYKKKHGVPVQGEKVIIEKYSNKIIPMGKINKYNVGYLFLEDIYYSLKLDKTIVNGKIKCRKSVNLNVGFPTSFLMIQLLLR